MNEPSDQDRRRIRFDPNISAGHLLTAAAMMVSIAVWAFGVDKRVTVLEQAIAEERTARLAGEAVAKDYRDELRSNFASMSAKFDRLIERLPLNPRPQK